MKELGKFHITTSVIFGKGSIFSLADLMKKNNFKNILVVTDKGIKDAGLLTRVLSQIEEFNYTVYDQTLPNPTSANCEKAYELLKQCKADVIIGIGGGSSLDVAKAVALLATNEGGIADFEGMDKFGNDILPLVAIPTTAGTASEVTNFTVITDEERHYKFTVGGSKLAAKWALLDPELTYGLPSHITAATGLDALVHAIESYTSKAANEMTKCLAREAIRKISRNLRQVVFNGYDEEAREEMLMGSLLAGMAFNNTRLGNCHAMSHPLSAYYGIPHGVANAILIPYIMNFNVLANPNLFSHIAEDMGGNLDGLTLLERARMAVKSVHNLIVDINLPTNLQSYEVKEDKIDLMVEDAMLSGNILVNPRVTSAKDLRKLYLQAIKGNY